MATVPIQDVGFVQSIPGYEVSLLPTANVDVVIFNSTVNSVFNSRDARKAASIAIDREAISNLVYYGYATIPTWPNATNLIDFKPEYGNIDDTYTKSHDMALAKEYAEKGGLVGKDVVIAITGSSESVTTAEIIQQNLKEIGVNASINSYDMASYVSVIQDTALYDIFITIIGSPSNLSLQNFFAYYIFLPTINQGTWEGKDRYKEIVDVIQGITDDAERAALIKEMNEIHTREAIWYALDQPPAAFAVNSALGGVEFMYNYNVYFGDWYWTA
jgi:peptide/nickel transport system substrate-binding protein